MEHRPVDIMRLLPGRLCPCRQSKNYTEPNLSTMYKKHCPILVELKVWVCSGAVLLADFIFSCVRRACLCILSDLTETSAYDA